MTSVHEVTQPSELYGCPEFSWSPNGPIEETAEERRARLTSRWGKVLLLLGVTIVALVLLAMFLSSASASAAGGCGGG